MNSIPKLIASIAALIASLAFLWIAYSTSKGIKIDHGRVRVEIWDLN